MLSWHKHHARLVPAMQDMATKLDNLRGSENYLMGSGKYLMGSLKNLKNVGKDGGIVGGELHHDYTVIVQDRAGLTMTAVGKQPGPAHCCCSPTVTITGRRLHRNHSDSSKVRTPVAFSLQGVFELMIRRKKN
jgi:hypothetical protein